MSHLQTLLRHFQALQQRHRDREGAKRRPSMPVGPTVDGTADTIILSALVGLLPVLNLFLRVPGAVGIIAEYNKF
jgi:hypothetical protein